MNQSQRNTLFVEEAEILDHQAHAGDQFTMRLAARETASRAQPGSFIHIQCSAERPMRRPLSIMRTDPKAGTIDLLYKVFGEGTTLLSQRKKGETLSLIGPIGTPFSPSADKKRPLLLGGGVGIPPMIFLADSMRNSGKQPLVLMGSEVPFPFTCIPSTIMVPGIPEGVIAAMPLMEDWGIPSRLTSLQDYAGCHEGYITDLGRLWLQQMNDEQRSEVELFACGPHPMLNAVAKLAREFDVPCQVSLEEFMACAVGGCAGCTVPVQTNDGIAMKRVCVDGPVFEADSVFFD